MLPRGSQAPAGPLATVLVVDDVPEILAYVEAVVGRYRRCAIDLRVTKDAIEGLDLARSRAYDLVISDYLMPHVNGIEILKAARERNPHGARVLITGFNEVPTTPAEIELAGLARELKKPVSAVRLLQLFDETLPQAAAHVDRDDGERSE